MRSVHGTLALLLSCILCVPLFAKAAEPVPRAKPEGWAGNMRRSCSPRRDIP
jgi:hypothetical protein